MRKHCWHWDGRLLHKSAGYRAEHQRVCCHCGRVDLALPNRILERHGPFEPMPAGLVSTEPSTAGGDDVPCPGAS